MTSQTPDEVMTAAEIGEMLRCSATHASHLCRTKKIPAVNLGGGLGWRAHRSDVEAFVRGKAARSTSTRTQKAAK